MTGQFVAMLPEVSQPCLPCPEGKIPYFRINRKFLSKEVSL